MSSGRIPSVEGGIQPTIVDAKGDLIVATAADTVSRLAVGSNDQVLTADSSTSTGLKWAAPAAGGMTLIQETVASANTSISFSSISGSYKQLFLIWSGIIHSTSSSVYTLRFNNDATDYSSMYLQGNGSSVSIDNMNASSSPYSNLLGTEANGTSLYQYVYGSILIDNYASTTKTKYFQFRTSYYNIASNYRGFYTGEGLWNDTSAITSLDIVRTAGTATISNATNTSIRLYGIS